jgi:hypothetical protein
MVCDLILDELKINAETVTTTVAKGITWCINIVYLDILSKNSSFFATLLWDFMCLVKNEGWRQPED